MAVSFRWMRVLFSFFFLFRWYVQGKFLSLSCTKIRRIVGFGDSREKNIHFFLLKQPKSFSLSVSLSCTHRHEFRHAHFHGNQNAV